ncbi:hypothetical protein MHU86_19979 [Fragilaria crotonensis]|nr:hypothetical protein MHU86_19979 [Fragilaria crotonensis]
MVLGRDLGPAIDIGPAMTRKVLKENGQVVYRSTVRLLTQDEMSDDDEAQTRSFHGEGEHRSRDGFKYEDFANDPELEDLGTPDFQYYADDDEGERTLVPEADEEPDVDTYDQYVEPK